MIITREGPIQVMGRARVRFPRPDPVTVDFARLLRRDTLVTRPPRTLGSTLGVLRRALPF
ncbi:hypothetical protein [Acrocarpospora catenulata]|uniref:hypothetical protein n=1 Tax=Acrocarpospora catenulata TaxID=2836182 RepID=UPI001BDA083F|nr:hypothetical protein [Acrocarpospora catenulata]